MNDMSFSSAWLIQLGVDPDIASADACKIEHVISKESFKAIKDHVLSGSQSLDLLVTGFFFYRIEFSTHKVPQPT